MHGLRDNRKWSAHHALLVEGHVELVLDTSNTCRHLGGFGGSERQVWLLGELGSMITSQVPKYRYKYKYIGSE